MFYQVITDVRNSDDLGNYVAMLLKASNQAGRQLGFEEGYKFGPEGRRPEEYALCGMDTASILSRNPRIMTISNSHILIIYQNLRIRRML